MTTKDSEQNVNNEEDQTQDASSATKDVNEFDIPKRRLDEALEANRKLKDEIDALKKEQQSQLEAQLKEQGRYKELAEQRATELAELRPKAETVDTYEATLISVLAAQIAEIPEAMRDLIPDELTTQQKLNWLSKNRSLLVKPAPHDIGAGKVGGGAPQGVDLTPDEVEMAKSFGLSPEEYAKYKDK